MPARHYLPLIERWLAKVSVGETPEDCWEWTGARTAPGWHGTISNVGRTLLAHRVSWEHYVGPIPEGMPVLHRCDNAGCVNVAHLFLGTQRDNMRDAATKGRMGVANKRLTHCKRGHPFTGERDNTGRRFCRTCKNERRAVWLERPGIREGLNARRRGRSRKPTDRYISRTDDVLERAAQVLEEALA